MDCMVVAVVTGESEKEFSNKHEGRPSAKFSLTVFPPACNTWTGASLLLFTKLGPYSLNRVLPKRPQKSMKPNRAHSPWWDLPANTKHNGPSFCPNKLAPCRLTSTQPVSMTTVPKVSSLHGNCHHSNLKEHLRWCHADMSHSRTTADAFISLLPG